MIEKVAEQMFQLAEFNPFDFDLCRGMLDLRGWIAGANYYVETLGSPSEFALSIRRMDLLKLAITNDINRFAVAALESIAGVRQESRLPKHRAWLAIRSYYGAFYSAHVIMRLFGRSCTQLDSGHTKVIRENASAVLLDESVVRVESGFYEIGIVLEDKRAVFSKLTESHADTWAVLCRLLRSLRERIRDTTGLSANKLASEGFLDAILQNLRHGGANRGNWLSTARNQINYRFAYNAWYPFGGAGKLEADMMERESEDWMGKASLVCQLERLDDTQRLFSCCLDLIRLCQHLIAVFATKADKIPWQLTNGVFRLKNLLGASNT